MELLTRTKDFLYCRTSKNTLATLHVAILITVTCGWIQPGNAGTLIEHSDVYPVSRAVMRDTAVLIDGGKIKAIGTAATAQADDKTTRIDATGLRLYPGLISANSSLGLVEIEAVRATVDTAETGGVNPNVRAQIAVHADSELLPVARAGGVLSALSVPQGQLIAGQSALINLSGWNYEEMTIKPAVAMHLYWPSARLPPWLPKPAIAQATQAALDNLALLETTFVSAQAYQAKAAIAGHPQDLRLAALLPVLNGTLPLFIHANELTQIRQAMAFCAKHRLKFTLVGALDAWRVAAELKAAGVDVILGSPFNLPLRRSESYDVFYRAAAKLNAAGVKVAIAGDGGGMDASLEKNLSYLAAQAAAFGLPEDIALRAVTLSAAEILGVSNRLGSIDLGKDANLILADGDILEITSKVKRIFIGGVDTAMTTRHTELCARYQSRYGANHGDSSADSCRN
jgi:imidazolonepropionase-like amidohydrolase